MKCKICGSHDVQLIYDDYIRDGAPGTLTKTKYQMFQCQNCHIIWHDIDKQVNEQYYQSIQYREKLENNSDIVSYYEIHDKEVLEKLQYTGTEIFRQAKVADIGCGGGSFLDFIAGPANHIVAIEPSGVYRKELQNKGYETYAYASDANRTHYNTVDVVTSFDVIEHVDNPMDFMKDVYDLLKVGGTAIIGTPSDCPILRSLMGKVYEQKLLYSFQHPWILSTESFKLCCELAGFKECRIEQKQRYGLSNLLAWLNIAEAKGHCKYSFVTDTMDAVYKREVETKQLADYLLAYIRK